MKGSVDPKQYLNFKLTSNTAGDSQSDSVDSRDCTLMHPFQTIPDDIVREVMDPKRMAVSSRRTHALQKSGLGAIREKVQ
jgi:hypothetical protein